MVNSPLQIGITGGIGSGKSLVCRVFEVLGAPVYYADIRAKQLIVENLELGRQIVEAFGEKSFVNGGYNRSYISSVVFNDPVKLLRLNNIIHPAVAKDYGDWVVAQGEVPYLVKEAALILEGENRKVLDRVYVVTAPEEVRINRVLSRDHQRTIDQIKAIILNQMPEQEMVNLSTGVIDNSGERMLIPQIIEVHDSLVHRR